MGRMNILLALAVLSYCTGACHGSQHMKKLIKDIFADYMSDVRPVDEESDTLNVNFGLALISFELYEEPGTLVSRAWLRYLWQDSELKWNPGEYGGIDHFRIRSDLIWKPDIYLYNSMSPTMEITRDSMAVISSDGQVLWIPPARLVTKCPSDGSEYNCTLIFGSWTYDGFKLDISQYDGLESVDLADYVLNADWELVGAPFKKNVKHYPCCEEPYQDLTATLIIRQRGLPSEISTKKF